VPPAPAQTTAAGGAVLTVPRQSPILNPGGSIYTDGFRAGQLVVMLKKGADPGAVASRWNLQVLDQMPELNVVLYGSPVIADTRVLIEPMSADPDVAAIEVNAIAQAPEAHARSSILFSIPENVTGNPQYGYELVGATGASCVSGQGVVVAVLDTGIDPDHPEFRGRLSDLGWNVLTGTSDFAETTDGIDDDGDGLFDEMYGHGTHVSGIIARVAPGAMLMPVKVLNDDGVGDAFGVAQGILYASENGAEVLNLSLSSTYDSEIVRASVAAARGKGALVVAATGNSGESEPKEYPAASDGVIGVAATDPNDVKSSFSNYGVEITLPGGKYGVASGTSMAAPFISAAVALMMDFYPDATPDQVEQIIETSSLKIDPLNPDYVGQLGAGRLDLSNAIDCRGKV
jgi:subtilisin family serine protease